MGDGKPALGSATHGPHIFDLRGLWGDPCFHPRGEHPATYRLREYRRLMEAMLHDYPLQSTRALEESLEYVNRKLAEFESGEDEAKRYAWGRIRGLLEARNG